MALTWKHEVIYIYLPRKVFQLPTLLRISVKKRNFIKKMTSILPHKTPQD